MSVHTAEKRAKSLLREKNILLPPVDVEKIAQDLGISIQYESFSGQGNLSGVLIRNEEKGEFIIGVNKDHPANRRRFTIAHEIGHFLLHEGNETYIDTNIRYNFRNDDSSTGTIAEEKEANSFAAALLMPEDMLEEYIDNHDGYIDYHDEEELEKMANAFEVSTQALLIRLGKLRMFV